MSKGKGIGKDPVPFPLPVGGKRMEVTNMADTQMEKLLAAQERALQQKHEADRKEKNIRKQIADLQRKERNHRLITRGAIVEKFIPNAESLSDDDVLALLSELINAPDAQRRLAAWLRKHSGEEPPIVVETVDGEF